MSSTPHIAIIGAGIAGLAAALELSGRGLQVTLLERAATVGGKLRQVGAGAAAMDAGPTVFTLRAIFEQLFARAGAELTDHVRLAPLQTLARHAWSDGAQLDLLADQAETEAAIAAFAGGREAGGYRRFCAEARRTYATLDHTFLRQPEPSLAGLIRSSGLSGVGDLWRLQPFTSLWKALGGFFRDPRLQQLFGRYATYCGSSPFLAPATLMLVAHVEQQGVWQIEGGMYSLARALLALLRERGVAVRLGAHVSAIRLRNGRVDRLELAADEALPVDAVIAATDCAALTDGLYGDEAAAAAAGPSAGATRSLSALTWNLRAVTSGFPLSRHNVFFSRDYAAEFSALFDRHAVPSAPTVYVCAQDRDTPSAPAPGEPERLLCLINAPAIGDRHAFDDEETDPCLSTTLYQLQQCGLRVSPSSRPVVTTPADFNRLFPGSGGALYGQASHGWQAAFRRPGARTPIPGLYLAGGSIHPGPGLPMAALSGTHAAACLRTDLAST